MIDFGVTESKSYSFFLDDELCEVHIERGQGNQFHYRCNLNREAATPLNQMRKASERKHWRQAIWLGGSLFGLAFILAVILTISMRPANPDLIKELKSRGGVRTTARIAQGKTPSVFVYSFQAGNKVYRGEIAPADTLTSFGLPVQAGDEFELRYVFDQPQFSYLDLARPSLAQIKRYTNDLAALHSQLHPELSSDQARCQVEAAYQLHGVTGFSRIYHQQREKTGYQDRPLYLEMIESPAFQRICPFQLSQ